MNLFPYEPTLNLLPFDGIANYYGPILASCEAQDYFEALLTTVPWRNNETVICGKRIITARKVAWYGDSSFAGWLTPFAFACGLFALALFAFLAAMYLTVDTRSEPDLQDDFRRRAIWAQFALIALAGVVFLTSKNGAPLMYRGLTNWWAPLLLLWTGLSATSALLALWFRVFRMARIAAFVQVSLILVGWGLAQFPHLVAPDVTIQNAAAPESTLKPLLIDLGVGVVVLLPSLLYLFQIFKRQEQR